MYAFTGKNSQAIASSSATSRFADIVPVEEFIQGQENENTRKKTEQNIALLKEFLTLKGESRAVEEIRPDELNSFISEFIVTMRKKDNNEDYEPSPLRGTLASFERYLKEKNYGYSIIRDVEFEKARLTNKTSSSQHAENSAKAVNKRCHFLTGVDGAKVKLCSISVRTK